MGFLWVTLGGAVGAACRYAIGLIPVKSAFPIVTLIINIIGAAAIGFVTGFAAARQNVSPNAVLFLKTGVCGGFTTFSTFSLEALQLFEGKQYLYGCTYVFFSVAFCIAGVIIGKKLSSLLA